jgi:hypothetical protein
MADPVSAYPSLSGNNLSSLADVFLGKSSTTSDNKSTTTTDTASLAASNAVVKAILEGTNGLASTAVGHQQGLYNSTTQQLLSNDLIARAGAQVAAMNKSTTVQNAGGQTTKINPQVNPLTSLTGIAALSLAPQSLKDALTKSFQSGKNIVNGITGQTSSTGLGDQAISDAIQAGKSAGTGSSSVASGIGNTISPTSVSSGASVADATTAGLGSIGDTALADAATAGGLAAADTAAGSLGDAGALAAGDVAGAIGFDGAAVGGALDAFSAAGAGAAGAEAGFGIADILGLIGFLKDGGQVGAAVKEQSGQVVPNTATLKVPYKSGGQVNGPGTTTSDSIPVRLSAQEYVLPAAVANKIGKENLDALVQSITGNAAVGAN